MEGPTTTTIRMVQASNLSELAEYHVIGVVGFEEGDSPTMLLNVDRRIRARVLGVNGTSIFCEKPPESAVKSKTLKYCCECGYHLEDGDCLNCLRVAQGLPPLLDISTLTKALEWAKNFTLTVMKTYGLQTCDMRYGMIATKLQRWMTKPGVVQWWIDEVDPRFSKLTKSALSAAVNKYLKLSRNGQDPVLEPRGSVPFQQASSPF